MGLRHTYEERNRKQKELRNALIAAPLILAATFGFVYGYIRLLEYCGLL